MVIFKNTFAGSYQSRSANMTTLREQGRIDSAGQTISQVNCSSRNHRRTYHSQSPLAQFPPGLI